MEQQTLEVPADGTLQVRNETSAALLVVIEVEPSGVVFTAELVIGATCTLRLSGTAKRVRLRLDKIDDIQAQDGTAGQAAVLVMRDDAQPGA